MPYKAAKISFDGSHYIATPKENFPQGHKRRRATRPLTDEETEKKDNKGTNLAFPFVSSPPKGKKYLEAPELTREMCYELIDRIIVGGLPKITGKEREIDIVYKVDIASVLRHKLKK